jgi:hypothetical protein
MYLCVYVEGFNGPMYCIIELSLGRNPTNAQTLNTLGVEAELHVRVTLTLRTSTLQHSNHYPQTPDTTTYHRLRRA